MSKRIFFTIMIVPLISLIVLVGCKNNKPEIKIDITLNKITNEEYKKLNDNNKPEGISIDDLKKLSVDVKIINSKKALERTIDIPDLINVINKYDDKVRGLFGGTGIQNNIGTEDTAESTAYVIFDSRGMSNKDIISLYNNSEITISYKLKDSGLSESKVFIGENIEVDN